MDFSWDKEALDKKDRAITFGMQLNATPVGDDRDSLKAVWTKCADSGIQGQAAPTRYGGQVEKVNLAEAILMMEGLGYGCKDSGISFGLNAQMWTVMTPILHFGSEEQKQKYLPPLCSGEMIGCHALTEPEAGSDVYSMTTSATKVDGGYHLTGHKWLITLAPIADVALIMAKTNAKLGKWGISAFLVDLKSPGLQVIETSKKIGLKSIPIGEIIMNELYVSDDCLLGKEGLGFSILNHSLVYDRCTILASQLGTMQRQLEESVAWAKTRKQFGNQISKYQSVSNRLVDMKVKIDTSRLLLYHTIWKHVQGENVTMDVAMVKLHLSESYLSNSLDAYRNYGGKAYLEDTGLSTDVTDALGGILYAGTSDIQKNIIAQLMGL